MNFPYQIVAFFNRSPKLGDSVYGGADGWIPNLTVKRRFGSGEMTENQMLDELEELADHTSPLTVSFKKTIQPEHMPVEVIEVEQSSELMTLHRTLFANFGPSKFPGREGANFYPHMTISWKGERVVDAATFENTQRVIDKIWIIKDDEATGDSRVLAGFDLNAK
jgi:hypothetical protein